MNKWAILILLVLLGCGNPSLTDDPSNGVPDNGTIPQEPDPSDPDDPLPPNEISLTIDAEKLVSGDLSGLTLPYKKKTVKTADYLQPRKTRSCPKKHKTHCTKNRQVLFKFQLDSLPYLLTDYRVKRVFLMGDYYSLGKNFKTELICLLNAGRCSGRGIIKFPVIGLPFLIKMLWWDAGFWVDGYDKVVKTKHFHDKLNSHWRKKDKMYIMKDSFMRFRDMFSWTNGYLNQIFKDNDKLVFAVTDDTFVENMKLKVILQEVR